MKDEELRNSRKTVLMELNEAFKGILHNHKYLNKLVKQGEEVIPSAEWLLDNIYLIEKEFKTIVVIPAILSNSRDVIKLMKKLEVYYLANRRNECARSRVRL